MSGTHEKAANSKGRSHVTKGKIRLLQVLSVICFVIAVPILITLVFMIPLATGDMGMLTEDMVISTADTFMPGLATIFLGLFSYALLVAIGVLGLVVPGRPKMAKVLAWVAGIRLLISVAKIIFEVANMQPMDGMDEFVLMSVAVNVVFLLFDTALFCLACWFARRIDDPEWKRVLAEARKDDASKLGFLRFIEGLFMLNIVFTIVVLLFTTRDNLNYDYENIMDWINVIFEGIALWLIIKRYRIARVFVVAYSSVNIIVAVILMLVADDFDVPMVLTGAAFDIFMITYFLCSQRTYAVLTRQLDFQRNEISKDDFVINRKGWPFWRNLIIYYCVFSMVGHWMEAGFCMLIRLGLVAGEYDPTNTMLWRDWFYPFPMEGLAVVFIALFLYPLKNWLVEKIKVPVLPYVISFLVNALLCGTIEFIAGFLVNADHQLWDYTNMPFNIMGQVCLQNVIGFGVVASLIAWLIYPLMERAIASLSKEVMQTVFVVVVVAYAIPQAMYIFDLSGFLPSDIADAGSSEMSHAPGSSGS